MPEDDTLWLDISGQEASCVIRQTYRLRTLIHSLQCPSGQTPTLVLFFESPERQYFPPNEEYGVHLRLDLETAGWRHPLLVASTQSLLSHCLPRCHLTQEPNRGLFVQESSFPRQESLSVLPRILLPFADVLCFMCINQSDLRVIEAQINQWMFAWREAGAATPMPGIVVLLAESDNLQPVTVQRQLAKTLPVAKVSVVRIDQSTWTVNGLRPIRKRLGQAASRARRWKISNKVLFSGSHMIGLLEESFGTAQKMRPFRYIEASRSRHPVTPDLVRHLNNYVRMLPRGYDKDFAAESIASSFLVDHFTPAMHGCIIPGFEIRDVFTALYQGACRKLSEDIDFPGTDLILRHMSLLHAKFERTGGMITSIHRQTMNRHRDRWLYIEGSSDTCFVCLRRRPEYLLPCDHTLCRSCVKDFGDQCHRPPTAGVGLLSLDGGGVRGIVQTEILRLLEERIGLPIPVQEHFQLAAGVSAGGLNLIALYLKGWHPEVCTRKYEEMSKVIFRKGFLQHVPVLSTVLAMWNKARYSSETLEQVIGETYGEKGMMLDPSYATSIGARIVLPAARSPTPSILLFTNYNGSGDNAENKGRLLTDQVTRFAEPAGMSRYPTWPEVAPQHRRMRRPICDVTGYGPKYVPGVGWLQDAGMVENNPISLLLSQYYELYPANATCQFLLSIGSGSKSDNAELPYANMDGGSLFGTDVLGYKTSALRRIASAYEWLLSGLSYWEKYTRSIDKGSELRDRCIRLDVSFEGMEPKLDDVRAVPRLKRRVRHDAALSAEIDSTVDCIIASLFYFELEAMPMQRGSMLNCSGHIRCLRKRGDPALCLLIEKLVAWNARFVIDNKIMGGNMLSPFFWDQTGNFGVPAEFQITGQELSVSLTWPDGRTHPISGSPYLIHQLVDVQGLNAPFGLPDHRRKHRAPRYAHAVSTGSDHEARKSKLERKTSSINTFVTQGSTKRRKLWW
ncbi:patatin-like phospholipase family protein [Metarhizium robertsii]|uniref:Patatin-like phospholipase family protein n=1 Tax=Metarhizium robertsii TaxID=568076 RepID=A0A0A1UN15_9HYPO|nr:patatin-like phospholipase family protein [Metarhizium robertsii]